MKTTSKLLSVVLAILLITSLNITAFAENTNTTLANTTNYTLTVQNNTMTFKRNAETYTYGIVTSDITLTTDSHDCLIICYYDKNGTYLEMSLEKQSTLSIYGALASLNLNSNLSKNTTINLFANTTTLDIASPSTVNVFGNITTSDIHAAAKVNVKDGGVIALQKLRDNAAVVSVEKGGVVQKSETNVAPKPVTTAKTYSLRVYKINAEEGQTLDELRNKLNNNITAIDTKTQQEIYGTASWTKSRNTEVYEDGKYSYTFTPDDKSYSSTRGSITVQITQTQRNNTVSLRYNEKTLYATGYESLRDLMSDLEEAVYAIDSRGYGVSGSFVWADSNYTTPQRDGTYKFTFVPSSSSYRNVTGQIKISVVALPQDWISPGIDDDDDDDDDFDYAAYFGYDE